MLYWYQKEYASGELYQALWDVAVIFQTGLFETAFTKIRKLEADSDVLGLMLHQLSWLVISHPHECNLSIKQGSFVLKERVVGRDEIYCLCRKTSSGWLFEVGGSGDFDFATSLGWQKLSNEHPLANTVGTIGPSQHLNSV
ncbi:MAG: hypothetical protein A3H64_00060 [Candidatus Ryanbacteria bacterium RIFCSPLOWO2_02_FULL_45_11c]|uniref:Uncharacterized protein n=1 Tax=Candidatus Ryanbacteria bacterium RIFCSPLOWO2_02_FULL_45_11c TaxID=1802128 RepID=A0A1G2GVF7_9BACT|nr:MAG: hypothetical protein A3H64_00060 [Candidatus Ryanbacteria bacterium RIFCSPLOWO2_02_FULL_45_11c]